MRWVSLNKGKAVAVPLADVAGKLKTVQKKILFYLPRVLLESVWEINF